MSCQVLIGRYELNFSISLAILESSPRLRVCCPTLRQPQVGLVELWFTRIRYDDASTSLALRASCELLENFMAHL